MKIFSLYIQIPLGLEYESIYNRDKVKSIQRFSGQDKINHLHSITCVIQLSNQWVGVPEMCF